MKPLQNILHPTDLSPASKPAFQTAVDLIRLYNARLHLLNVAPIFGDDPLRNAFAAALDENQFYRALRDDMDRQMRGFIASQHAENLPILRIHSRGPAPAPVIVDYALQQHIDLIVIGTHGYRGLRKMILGSVSTEVARTAPCDVLTVRTVSDFAAEVQPSILVAIDLSSASEFLLKKAKHLAERHSARVDIMHVIESVPLPAWGVDASLLEQFNPQRKATARDAAAALVDRASLSSIDHTIHIAEGKPAAAIAAHAREYDNTFIALAPRSSGWLDHFPLGSVASRVIAMAPCPVYSLRIELSDIDNPKLQLQPFEHTLHDRDIS